jgi:DNA-binding NarL/FixJ family response regulator
LAVYWGGSGEFVAYILLLPLSNSVSHKGRKDIESRRARLMGRPSRVSNHSHSEILLGCCLPLTRREKQVINLVRRGLTSKEIAGMLEVSEYTVKKHLKNGLLKMV